MIAKRFEVAVDECGRKEWSAILAQFSDSSIYQTREYGETAWGASQLSHLVLRYEGQLVSAAQVRVRKAPVFGGGIAYVRWGPLVKASESLDWLSAFEATIEALQDEYVSGRGLSLFLLPRVFDSEPNAVAASALLKKRGFTASIDGFGYRTIRLDLDSDLTELRAGLNQKWRNMLTSSEKNGLAVTRDPSMRSFDIFLSLYDELITRKGFKENVDPRKFRSMQESLADGMKQHVFLCWKDEKPICGAIVTLQGAEAIYLFGATGKEALDLRASYFLHWKIVEWLKEQGARFYDLGGIDPHGNPGVYRFKKGFSGTDSHLISPAVLWRGWWTRFLFWAQGLLR